MAAARPGSSERAERSRSDGLSKVIRSHACYPVQIHIRGSEQFLLALLTHSSLVLRLIRFNAMPPPPPLGVKNV